MNAGNMYWDKLTPDERRAVTAVQLIHPYKITPEYAQLIDWNNPEDPLRKQVVPSMKEMCRAPHESIDPLDERKDIKRPGLIHKYVGRALWTLTQKCPIHCRFCFRQWKNEAPKHASPAKILQNLESIACYLENNPEISEIILSGGDPLCLERQLLDTILRRLNTVKSIRHIRIHTRAPVVAWTNEQVMKPPFSQPTVVTRIVLHINHPNEIRPELKEYVRHMLELQIPVLSQSVLLAGVNDDQNTLFQLFSSLIDIRIQPYYLHQKDAALGTAHFQTPDAKARVLVKQIRERLPGYAVPKLVRDIPGAAAKTPL